MSALTTPLGRKDIPEGGHRGLKAFRQLQHPVNSVTLNETHRGKFLAAMKRLTPTRFVRASPSDHSIDGLSGTPWVRRGSASVSETPGFFRPIGPARREFGRVRLLKTANSQRCRPGKACSRPAYCENSRQSDRSRRAIRDARGTPFWHRFQPSQEIRSENSSSRSVSRPTEPIRSRQRPLPTGQAKRQSRSIAI